jgi:hypothetical protein
MQQELLIRAITQGTIGIISIALLLVLLLTLRGEIHGRKRLSSIVIFALAMLGLWSFLAFAEVYVSLREIIMSHDLQISRGASVSPPTRTSSVGYEYKYGGRQGC